jgi:hypothetical protein
VTQYCQGVASGATSCPGFVQQRVRNQAGVLAGIWYDNGSPAPAQPTQAQLADEAVRAAGHFGNTTASANAGAQYFVATAHGNNAPGFASLGGYCAWHSSTSSAYGNIAYTNFPYITDAGVICGANFNGLGPNAGITIVAGHEFAETETDPLPSSGWIDNGNEEIGDKCAWLGSGPGATTNVTLSTGTFPVQSLWSNASNGGAGGCVLSTTCTPGAARSCCPYARGCLCLGTQTCNADGSGWGTCTGGTVAGSQTCGPQ